MQYGALPCFRDYKKEAREAAEKKRREEEAAAIQRELMQAVSSASGNPLARMGGSASAGSAVKQLVQEKEKQERDNALLRAMLAEQAQRSAEREGVVLEARVAVPPKRKQFEPSDV
jgi:hypothetical protein